MHCNKCGEKINEKENFCHNCGAKIDDSPVEESVLNDKPLKKKPSIRDIFIIIILTIALVLIIDGPSISSTMKSSETLSSKEIIAFENSAEDCINGYLKSPSTAKYPSKMINFDANWLVGKNENIITVFSYVDSQNGFGAETRSKFECQMEYDTKKITFVKFGDEILYGTYIEF